MEILLNSGSQQNKRQGIQTTLRQLRLLLHQWLCPRLTRMQLELHWVQQRQRTEILAKQWNQQKKKREIQMATLGYRSLVLLWL
jgi:hypothetical protein